jgi:hypothetical protein
MRSRRAASAELVAVVMLLLSTTAWAANPAVVQLFYVPFPEDQLLQRLVAIENGGGGATPVSPVTTYISIAAVAPNTIVYYDQWENGYDPDIANPANLYSGGNPGGTQVWGNGNAADGAPPSIPGDVINAGTVIVLSNSINTANLAAIDFDGRDKIAATKTVAVTRVGWATGPNTLLAGALEVFDTDNWGTDYRAPVGAALRDRARDGGRHLGLPLVGAGGLSGAERNGELPLQGQGRAPRRRARAPEGEVPEQGVLHRHPAGLRAARPGGHRHDDARQRRRRALEPARPLEEALEGLEPVEQEHVVATELIQSCRHEAAAGA